MLWIKLCDYMGDINIIETIEDANSWFNIKRFRFHGLSCNGIEKALSLNNLTKNIFIQDNNKSDFKFLEISKSVTDFDRLIQIKNCGDDKKINDFFGKRAWLDEQSTLLNFTFNFNPKDYYTKFDDIAFFYNYLYNFSGDFVFVPNLKIIKWDYSIFDKPTKKVIVSIDDYIAFIDESYEYLNTKNKKAIFVPISTRFSMGEIEKLINHYIKKEYYNYWIDFEAMPINDVRLSKLQRINSIINDAKLFNKVLFIFTNIKREIISNNKNSESPASNILSSVAGGNIIGVDKEPQRPISKKIGFKEVIEHKARLFDSSSYYYIKTDIDKFQDKRHNVLENSHRLYSEFKAQENAFLKEFDIGAFLKTKKMLTDYKKGTLLKSLMKDSQQNFSDWI